MDIAQAAIKYIANPSARRCQVGERAQSLENAQAVAETPDAKFHLGPGFAGRLTKNRGDA
jgi:hypothetical protein